MTNLIKSFDDKLPTLFSRSAVGFNRLFEEMDELYEQFANCKYPAFNLKRYEDGCVAIELAVAGYVAEDLEVESMENKIVVRGQNYRNTPEDGIDNERSHYGIAARRFERVFPVAGKFEVEDVVLENGLLTVNIKTELEEEPVTRHEITIK